MYVDAYAHILRAFLQMFCLLPHFFFTFYINICCCCYCSSAALSGANPQSGCNLLQSEFVHWILVCICMQVRLCVLLALTLLSEWKCISWAWPTLGCKRMKPWVHLVCTNRVDTHLCEDFSVHTSLSCVVQVQTVAHMISFCAFALHFKCIHCPQPPDTFYLR